MALNFPSSPTVGDTYTANSSTWVWNGTNWASGASLAQSQATEVTISSTTPIASALGDLWWNDSTKQLKIYYDNGVTQEWVDANVDTLAVSKGGTGTSTALTTGSVIFAGASGVYSQDNANLFWDNTNNRLGIGTASPGQTLTVAGTIESTTGGIKFPDGSTQTSAVSTGKAIAMAMIFGG